MRRNAGRTLTYSEVEEYLNSKTSDELEKSFGKIAIEKMEGDEAILSECKQGIKVIDDSMNALISQYKTNLSEWKRRRALHDQNVARWNNEYATKAVEWELGWTVPQYQGYVEWEGEMKKCREAPRTDCCSYAPLWQKKCECQYLRSADKTSRGIQAFRKCDWCVGNINFFNNNDWYCRNNDLYDNLGRLKVNRFGPQEQWIIDQIRPHPGNFIEPEPPLPDLDPTLVCQVCQNKIENVNIVDSKNVVLDQYNTCITNLEKQSKEDRAQAAKAAAAKAAGLAPATNIASSPTTSIVGNRVVAAPPQAIPTTTTNTGIYIAIGGATTLILSVFCFMLIIIAILAFM